MKIESYILNVEIELQLQNFDKYIKDADLRDTESILLHNIKEYSISQTQRSSNLKEEKIHKSFPP